MLFYCRTPWHVHIIIIKCLNKDLPGVKTNNSSKANAVVD